MKMINYSRYKRTRVDKRADKSALSLTGLTINKILILILGLLSINAVREYLWVKPPFCEEIKQVSNYNLDIAEERKNWDYYETVFYSKAGIRELVKSIDEKSEDIYIPLALRGTVISDPRNSFAIIEDLSTKNQDLYRLGDMINGAKIVAMSRNKVTLDYGGAKQDLDLNEQKSGKAPREVKQMDALGVNSNTAIVQNETVSKEANKELNMDFSKILTQLRIQPYFDSGRCVGFQISNINSSFIKQMGLKDGDIVQSINGERIDDPLKALQIIYAIQKNNPVQLGIERQAEKIELDCKVEG